MRCVGITVAIIVCFLTAKGSTNPVTQHGLAEPPSSMPYASPQKYGWDQQQPSTGDHAVKEQDLDFSRTAYASPQKYGQDQQQPSTGDHAVKEQDLDFPRTAYASPQKYGQDQQQPSTADHAVKEQDYLDCFRDCDDAYLQGVTTSGIYKIQPDDTGPPFNVYCDMDTDEGGWTVFQRRKDGSVGFYLNWIDYVRGFGDLNGEFWLGLRNIHRLTGTASASDSQLRVDMEDFDSNVAYAKYDSFNVGDATSKYTLSVAGYSGTAGDSLGYHNGMRFSTKDEDNDEWGENCAVTYRSAWWHKACHLSNLNGLYLSGPAATFADSVNWKDWKGYHYSLKFTEMKTRHN